MSKPQRVPPANRLTPVDLFHRHGTLFQKMRNNGAFRYAVFALLLLSSPLLVAAKEKRSIEASGDLTELAGFLDLCAFANWSQAYFDEYDSDKRIDAVNLNPDRSVHIYTKKSKDNKNFMLQVTEWNPLDGESTPFFKIRLSKRNGRIIVTSSSNRDKMYGSNKMHEDLALWIEDWESRNDQYAFLRAAQAELQDGWEAWLGMPPLQCAPLSDSDLAMLHGTWSGSCSIKGERMQVRLTLGSDQTWSSDNFWGERKHPRWYLYEGLIYLFDGETATPQRLISALCPQPDGTFQLINADCEEKYIILSRVDPET